MIVNLFYFIHPSDRPGYPILSTAVTIGAAGSIPDAIVQSIEKCEVHIRKDMYGSIVLSGVTEEVATNVKNAFQQANVVVPEQPHTAFAGASILTGLSAFVDSWITAEDYATRGSSAVFEQKCLF